MAINTSWKSIKVLTCVTLLVGTTMHVWHIAMHWDLVARVSRVEKFGARLKYDRKVHQQGHHNKKKMFPQSQRSLISRPDIMLPSESNVCEHAKDRKVDLLILIMSKYSEISLRNRIRQTWTTATRNNTSNVRHAFVVANNITARVADGIEGEARRYNDIVVLYDVIDSYENLTVKTTLGLKYAASYCSRARYVMKTDSDVYVNIPPFLKNLTSDTTLDVPAFGLLRANAMPIRNKVGPNRKWFVTYEEFSALRYPNYLDGMGYVLSMRTVKALVEVFPVVNFFRFEDVYIGMCLERLGIQPVGSRGFFRSDGIFTLCSHKADQVFAVHGVFEEILNVVWRLNCSGMQRPVIRTPTHTRHRWIKHTNKNETRRKP